MGWRFVFDLVIAAINGLSVNFTGLAVRLPFENFAHFFQNVHF